MSPNADLAEGENIDLDRTKVEEEKVEEEKRFIVPETSGKGPKRLRPFSTRETGRVALGENPEWDEILSEDSIREADEEGKDLEDKYLEELDKVSLALELYHNFTLVHDDVNDGDPLRRNIPSTWNEQKNKAEERGLDPEEALEHGEDIAINIGNDVRELAYQIMLDSGFRSEKIVEMQRQVVSSGSRIIDGQLRDLEMEKLNLNNIFNDKDGEFIDLLLGENDSAEKIYLDMIDKKTVDLYVASVDVGAIAANASEDQRDHLRRFARNIGIPFQIRDDINEIRSVSSYGDDNEDIGKEATDIRNGKTTLPVLSAYANIEKEIDRIEEEIQDLEGESVWPLKNRMRRLEQDQKVIEGFYGNEQATDEQVEQVADVIFRYETASDLYEEKISQALYHLEEANLEKDAYKLEMLAEFMKERDY